MAEELILKGKLIIKGKIEAKTGLRIGGASEGLEIGGIDNPVIKKMNGEPYIPGSSLKGKLRSLLEKKKFELIRVKDKDSEGFPEKSVHKHKPYEEIYQIFGIDAENAKEPVRIIVRDCNIVSWEEKDETEIKAETVIDRITSAANPRKMERVPAGAQFNFEIILNIFKNEDKDLLDHLLTAMKLLEDDYLGGSGSRGSGKIKFVDIDIEYRHKGYYERGEGGNKLHGCRYLKEFETKLEDVKNLIKDETD